MACSPSTAWHAAGLALGLVIVRSASYATIPRHARRLVPELHKAIGAQAPDSPARTVGSVAGRSRWPDRRNETEHEREPVTSA
jgi:hypothetical protein